MSEKQPTRRRKKPRSIADMLEKVLRTHWKAERRRHKAECGRTHSPAKGQLQFQATPADTPALLTFTKDQNGILTVPARIVCGTLKTITCRTQPDNGRSHRPCACHPGGRRRSTGAQSKSSAATGRKTRASPGHPPAKSSKRPPPSSYRMRKGPPAGE